MPSPLLHRFQIGEQRFVIDPSTCFCFECDHISWDVLEHYPHEPLNRIYHLLRDKHPRKELEEVVGELEWLRVTKAILVPPKDDDLLQETSGAPGLEKMSVVMSTGTLSPEQKVVMAGNALLAASGTRPDLALHLHFTEGCENPSEAVAAGLQNIRRTAQFAGKTLHIAGCLPYSVSKAANDAHYTLQVTLRDDADIAAGIRTMAGLYDRKPGKRERTLTQEQYSSYRIVARPNNENVHHLLKILYDAGFRDMALDIPGAYGAHPQLDPAAMADALRANASWYAEQLLQRRYFRAEPFASLFDAVHQGKPVRRADGAGWWERAIDGEGRVFPSPDFLEEARFQIGTLCDGKHSPEAVCPFESVSASRMPACLQCWARCLCGGGHAIIHYRRTGRPDAPDPRWCDGQRLWLSHVINAFNTLASAGVNFSHIAGAMGGGHAKKMSWLQAAKTAYQMRLIPRPLQENDAEWLVKWENWNDAAYFTCNEGGLLLATRYDREMDALHPRGMEQELVLTRHNGDPCGLLKVRPEATAKGIAWVWLYMRSNATYAESGAQRALRTLLDETSRTQGLKRILVPVTAAEPELAQCLEALGFKRMGARRQALYLHGAYQDMLIYSHIL